MAFQTIFAKNK